MNLTNEQKLEIAIRALEIHKKKGKRFRYGICNSLFEAYFEECKGEYDHMLIVRMRDVIPEVLLVKPKYEKVEKLAYWWKIDPYDKTNRTKALKKLIEILKERVENECKQN